MSNYTENFLRRMLEYRTRLNMTQQQVGEMLGFDQSQFSKMERGDTIVSYDTLKLLAKAGWDTDELIAGKRFPESQNATELNALVQQAREPSKARFLEYIALLLEKGLRKCTPCLTFETKCELEILKTKADTGNSAMYIIREMSGMTQIPMAEKLGVGIKKYRHLEKTVENPDAELLSCIFENTGCRPGLFLNQAGLEEMVINDLWGQMTPPVQDKILFLAKQALEFIQM